MALLLSRQIQHVLLTHTVKGSVITTHSVVWDLRGRHERHQCVLACSLYPAEKLPVWAIGLYDQARMRTLFRASYRPFESLNNSWEAAARAVRDLAAILGETLAAGRNHLFRR